MNEEVPAIVSQHSRWEPKLKFKTYLSGYLLCLTLTLAAYILVSQHAFSRWSIAGLISVLALIQFFIQLIFFLHLGRELKPRYRVLAFCFMATVVFILVGGSLWIMHSLNYNMITPSSINRYMQRESQDGL